MTGGKKKKPKKKKKKKAPPTTTTNDNSGLASISGVIVEESKRAHTTTHVVALRSPNLRGTQVQRQVFRQDPPDQRGFVSRRANRTRGPDNLELEGSPVYFHYGSLATTQDQVIQMLERAFKRSSSPGKKGNAMSFVKARRKLEKELGCELSPEDIEIFQQTVENTNTNSTSALDMETLRTMLVMLLLNPETEQMARSRMLERQLRGVGGDQVRIGVGEEAEVDEAQHENVGKKKKKSKKKKTLGVITRQDCMIDEQFGLEL